VSSVTRCERLLLTSEAKRNRDRRTLVPVHLFVDVRVPSVSPARTPFAEANPYAERYASLASRCSEADLRAVWAAVLFGRRSTLRANLEPIAVELDTLRAEVGRTSAERREHAARNTRANTAKSVHNRENKVLESVAAEREGIATHRPLESGLARGAAGQPIRDASTIETSQDRDR